MLFNRGVVQNSRLKFNVAEVLLRDIFIVG